MIAFEAAQELIRAEARSFGKEIIWLDEALGRVLNEPLVADRDYPPFNRATMDGIAIRYSDWQEGIRSYEVAATIFAGMQMDLQLQSGQCFRIMTGAAVPEGCDTVIRKEDIEATENRLTITISELTKGQNIAPKGSDLVAGAVITDKATRISAGQITSLAALGYAEVKVASLPSVAIATTGNEIMPVDMPVNDVQVRNSNGPLLKALLEEWKIQPAVVKHLPDDENAILNWIKQQQQQQLIILSGAVSAGDADYVPAMLKQAGAEEIFHKVAIRPGKPVWFGRFKNGPVVFALPGNPFSTFVTFKIFIDDYLRACFGIAPMPVLQLPFNGTRVKKNQLKEFFPVAIGGSPASASAIPFNTSGDITAVVNASALAIQESSDSLMNEGGIITCIPL